MDHREQKNRRPCIVDAGVLYHRRDMARILRDLVRVRYVDLNGGEVAACGEGQVVSIFASEESSTIVFNERIYLNLNTFEYAKLGKDPDGASCIDLVDEHRILRLIPLPWESFDAPADLGQAPTTASAVLDRWFSEAAAEVFAEDDDEEL
jgi:hypothetical protein